MPSSTKFVGVGANDTQYGTQSWSNPGNILADDGSISRFQATTAGVVSNYLKGTGCGFAIPTGATIDGIVVEIERHSSAGTTRDNRVRIVKADGSIGTTDKADTVTDWPGSVTVKSYGGPTDLWGESWTPADINSANFGAVLAAECVVAQNRGDVDFIRITVHYTEGGAADGGARVSWAEVEVPDPPPAGGAQLSWAELETPDPPGTQDGGAQVSWAELEVPNAPAPSAPAGILLHRTPVPRRELPSVTLLVDGRELPMEPDWSATEIINGGYERLTAQVPAARLQGRSIGQEAPVELWAPGIRLWKGKMSSDPKLGEGRARIAAEGPMAAAEERAGPLLYQFWGFRPVWKTGEEPPHELPGQDAIDSEVRDGALFWRTPKDESYLTGRQKRFVVWLPGTPGGITRVAGTRIHAGNTASFRYRIARFTGPLWSSGAETQVGGLLTVDGGDFDVPISGGEDALIIALRVHSDVTIASTNRYRLWNLRINGIFPGDDHSTSEVVTDVAQRLGWDTFGIKPQALNAMPFFHEEGGWADILDYMSVLGGWYWLALDDPADRVPARAIFQEFGTERWHAYLDRGAREDLEPLGRYNRVTVPYRSIEGSPLSYSADAEVDPFAGDPNVGTVEFPADELEDPQPRDTLARGVAEWLVAELAQPRWRGSIELVEAFGAGGERNPQTIHPGAVLELPDFVLGAVEHRIWTKELGEGRVRLGIEDEVDPAGLLAQDANEQTRKLRRRRRKKKGKK